MKKDNVIVYEITTQVFMLKSINANQGSETIAALLDNALCLDDDFKKLHQENKFKNYSFGNLTPIEESFMFNKGNIYSFKFRTIDKGLCDYFKNAIEHAHTDRVKVLTVELKIVPRKHISKIYTSTPAIFTTKKGYWRDKGSITLVEDMMVNNLVKNYAEFTGINLGDDLEVFNTITIKNKKPLPSRYKGMFLLGDKFELRIANNHIAQELAYFCLGVSLGEKGSRGFGFANQIYDTALN
jgi:CRISPR-associated endoribonuclease Cas6